MINTHKKTSVVLTYVRGHKRACKEGLLMPWSSPVKSILTIATLAICFYIPMFLWTLWANYDELKQSWQNQGTIAIFLDGKIDVQQAGILLQEIKAYPIVASVKLITSEQVKEELKQDKQLAQIFEQISVQDLPQQLSIKTTEQASVGKIDLMLSKFKINPQIEYISYDQQWLSQLHTLTDTLLQMARISALMFVLIIMVILGNIIANEVSNHRNELRLLELIGASWAQVRRSFLYMGTFFGIYAGVLAVIFLSITLWWFEDKITALSQSFGSQISIQYLNYSQMLMVIFTSILVTWLAARLTLSMQKLHQTQD
ncbi:MAG: permease-like cell division protein FtsX [Proteobacteria bacterium]|nr:permease-like cell division protein FtsX [Pseudomonadota bacterium]